MFIRVHVIKPEIRTPENQEFPEALINTECIAVVYAINDFRIAPGFISSGTVIETSVIEDGRMKIMFVTETVDEILNLMKTDKELAKVSFSQSEKMQVHPQVAKNDVPYSEIVEYLNQKTGKNFRAWSAATRRLIHARWQDGFSLNSFKTVIDKKAADWRDDPRMAIYLRPQTLFGTKFEAYLNQEFSATDTDTDMAVN